MPFSAAPGLTPSPRHADFYAIQRVIGNERPFRFDFKENKWAEACPLVFVCSGQGSQWNKMGQDLMKESHVFRTTIERLERETGIPLVNMYEGGTGWMSKSNSAIGIVSYQLGIIAILAAQCIQPDFFLGHSLGGIPCAYLARFQTACAFTAVRLGLIQRFEVLPREKVFRCQDMIQIVARRL